MKKGDTVKLITPLTSPVDKLFYIPKGAIGIVKGQSGIGQNTTVIGTPTVGDTNCWLVEFDKYTTDVHPSEVQILNRKT